MKNTTLFITSVTAIIIAAVAEAAPVVTSNNGLAIWFDVRDNVAANQLITTSPSAP